ncbi:MAG: methionine adenosyltransferase, partial [Nanoarchaeota archaeon]|nr:methionine adenosyltransferase [Nanoarchaeota archaeon]
MVKKSYVFSSESVTEGHPDKVADKISDSILDACLAEDSESRVACETLVKGYMPDENTVKYAVVLAGEITTKANLENNFLDNIVMKTLKEIGYNSPESGFDANDCQIIKLMTKQSPDIAQGVNEGQGDFKEQGAGDQGMMFGFASNETDVLMPLPIVLAHKLTSRLTYMRKSGKMPYLFPDGKSQVAVKYINGKPKLLENVIIAAQHNKNVDMKQLREDMKRLVISPVCKRYMSADTKLHINATGKFIVGGPLADAGVTGRKIIVDTYGGMGKHGGGAFSGKDPSKVDRSGAY